MAERAAGAAAGQPAAESDGAAHEPRAAKQAAVPPLPARTTPSGLPVSPAYFAARPAVRSRAPHAAARRAAVHARHPPGDVSRRACDDAPVRRLRPARADRTSASGSCSARARPGCRSRSTCRRRWATTAITRWRAARSGRVGVAISCLADMEDLLDELPLERVTTSMTINATAPLLLAFYVAVADARGIRRDAARRHGAERRARRSTSRAARTSIRPRPSLRLITDVFEFTAREVPQVEHASRSAATTCARPGSTAVQELAFTLAERAHLPRGRARSRARPR